MTDTGKPRAPAPAAPPDAYHPEAVEAKWQARWAERRTNEPDLDARRAAVLQPHDVPLPLGGGAARGEHVRLHRERRLRPVQAAAGVRRLRADRLRRLRDPQRELRDQDGDQPRHPDPEEHRELPPPAQADRRDVRLAARALAPPIRPTTSGPSGSSSSSSRRGRRTRSPPRSTGAPRTRPCWPTSRSSTATASAAARRWSSGCWSSGSSGSPSTPTGCWPTWTTSRRWTGRRAPPRRSGTGWGGRRGRSWTSRSRRRCRSPTATRTSR